MKAFRCIVADPAWQFRDKLPGEGIRGAAKHYGVLSIDELCRLMLPPIADDAHLFLWRVSAMQPQALALACGWGFEVKSELVWLKRTVNGNRHFGMGRHVRMEHETCLIATRGRGAGVLNHSTRSTFEAQVGRHSEKPREFFKLVESLVPGPRLELFARAKRRGWTCIGDELGTRLEVAA